MAFLDSLLGGLLIGSAALLLYATLGRIAGISGITFGVIWNTGSGGSERLWRVIFLLALGAGAWLAATLGVPVPAAPLPQGNALALLIVSGLLVGFGTRMGNGCTSGHGVCGIARLSPRSLIATGVFMVAGMLTATLLRPFIS